MANHEQEPGATPALAETTPRKEVLGRERAGLQASLLLDGIVPQAGSSLDREKLRLVKEEITGGNYPKLERITKSSYDDRDAFWKQDRFKNLASSQDRRTEWVKQTNRYLQTFAVEEKKEEAAILNRIGMGTEKGASNIYEEFFVQRKGDIGYFATKVAGELSEEEISKHINLIQTLGRFYGENSAEVARHLTEAVKNVREESFKEFVKAASGQFSPTMEGVGVLEAVQKRALAWEAKQGHPEPAQQRQAAPDRQAQPDKLAKEGSKEPLVVEADRATEGKRKGPYSFPNQDASFVDEQNGAFGVFDGVSSGMMSKEIAEAAAQQIATGLAENLPLSLDAAKERVGQVVENVSKKLSQDETARYQTVVAYIQRMVSGAMSTDEFDQEYAVSKNQSEAQWIKAAFDPNKLDELPQDVKSWIAKRIRGATTCSVVKIWQGENRERKAIIANIGDSRIYHYAAEERKLKIITVDDNLLNEFVDKEQALKIQEDEGFGRETNDILKGQKRTLDQSNPRHAEAWDISFLQKRFPWGPNGKVEVPLSSIDNTLLMKALPMADLELKPSTIDVKPQDRIIVMSDGIYKSVLTPDMEKVLTDPANSEAKKAAKALVQLTIKQGRGPEDDATAVVINL